MLLHACSGLVLVLHLAGTRTGMSSTPRYLIFVCYDFSAWCLGCFLLLPASPHQCLSHGWALILRFGLWLMRCL